MNSVPAFLNSVIELFRDACKKSFEKSYFEICSRKKLNGWIEKNRNNRITVHRKIIAVDFIPLNKYSSLPKRGLLWREMKEILRACNKKKKNASKHKF